MNKFPNSGLLKRTNNWYSGRIKWTVGNEFCSTILEFHPSMSPDRSTISKVRLH